MEAKEVPEMWSPWDLNKLLASEEKLRRKRNALRFFIGQFQKVILYYYYIRCPILMCPSALNNFRLKGPTLSLCSHHRNKPALLNKHGPVTELASTAAWKSIYEWGRLWKQTITRLNVQKVSNSLFIHDSYALHGGGIFALFPIFVGHSI